MVDCLHGSNIVAKHGEVKMFTSWNGGREREQQQTGKDKEPDTDTKITLP